MSLTGTIVGYDPGGNNDHGLALIKYDNSEIQDVNISTHSTAYSIIAAISDSDNIIAMGIDTLTCWSTGPSGWRPADRFLKNKYPEITNSIISANSLHGSMVLNGMSVIIKIKALFPNIHISETHPKVLYFELSKKKYNYDEHQSEMDILLSELLQKEISTINDHEWDAAFSVYAVSCGLLGKWNKDLHTIQTQNNEMLVEPCGTTSYWWPENKVGDNMSPKPGENQSLFDECINDIESAYKELGHSLGWRFLSVSKSVLNGPVKVVLVTINPAGNEIPPDHPWPSCENGVSYVVERWGNALPGQSKLQIQVQKLFEMLRGPLNYKGSYMDLMSQSLISHFIPFRSPRFGQLARQDESIEFGHALWKKILPVVHPQLIICLGRDVQEQIRSLIQSELSGKLVKSDSFPTGWGNYNAELDIFKNSEGNIRLLYLPHLSTWTLFTSDKCVENMPGIIDAAASGL